MDSKERETRADTHTHTPQVGDDLCVCRDLVVQLPAHLHYGGLQQRVHRVTHTQRERKVERERDVWSSIGLRDHLHGL